jgi:hypothetical protein
MVVIMLVVMRMLVKMMPVIMPMIAVVIMGGRMDMVVPVPASLRARRRMMMVVQQTARSRGQQIGRDRNSAGDPGDEHGNT